jgi:hypothetical protein
VKVSVDQGVATLTGTVELYQDKADAGKRVRKARGVASVRNLIEVAGPTLSDEKLASRLREKLAYDRVFYGNAFNAITVSVENGRVTLSGHARTDVDKDSARDLVSTCPGVKEMVDEIEVDPVSIFDNRIRRGVFDAHPHLGAERQCGVVRNRGLAGRQGHCLPPRQRRPRRLQREELPPGRRPAS